MSIVKEKIIIDINLFTCPASEIPLHDGKTSIICLCSGYNITDKSCLGECYIASSKGTNLCLIAFLSGWFNPF